MPRALTATIAVVALIIGLIAGSIMAKPGKTTITEYLQATETIEKTETVTSHPTETATRTIKTTITTSIPTTITVTESKLLTTTILIPYREVAQAKCINGFCPMPRGFLYLVKGVKLGKPQPPKGWEPIIIPEDAEIVELKPRCCLHGLPYVMLPELGNETAAIVWRAIIYPLENTSVGHMVWILPAKGEILSLPAAFSAAFPYERPPRGDVKVILYNAMNSVFGRFVDKSVVLRDMNRFDQATLEYLKFAKGTLSRHDYINGELCVMNPYCLCCLSKEFGIMHVFGRLENISAGASAISTANPVELLKAVKVVRPMGKGYSCALVSAVSAAAIYLNYTSNPVIAVAGMIVSGEPT